MAWPPASRRIHAAAATASVLALTLVAAPRPAAAEEMGRFERTLKVSGPVELAVSSGSGSITVQPSADGTVRIVGTIHGNTWRKTQGDVQARVKRIEAQPPIVQTGAKVTVGRTDDQDRDLYENISISYDVQVPAATMLTARTGSGSIMVGALRGPVETHSGSGSLDIGATGGPVTATTGSGRIVVAGAKERVEARSGSGSVTLRGIAGSATVNTGSGTIEVEQTAAGNIELSNGSGSIRAWGVKGGLIARTGSGSIRVQGSPSGTWDVNSSSGSLHLSVPADAAFTLRASTSSGSINVDHPVTVQGTIDRRRLEGTVRGGGPTIMARTSSGSIDINTAGAAAPRR